MAKPATIDDYISGFPQEIQNYLIEMMVTIRKAAPDAGETISYGIPAFTLNGNLVHFAAFKNHIGFYPTSSGIKSIVYKQFSIFFCKIDFFDRLS